MPETFYGLDLSRPTRRLVNGRKRRILVVARQLATVR